MLNLRKTQNARTVGIMGAGNGCGVTHFAVLLANYLAAVERERVAVFEWNPRNDLEKLVNIYMGCSAKAPVSLFDVDYFFHGGQEELRVCIQGGYETILLDLGAAAEGRQTEFLQCQRKCVFLALNEWKLNEVIAQKELLQKGKEQWDFFMVFGSGEARREICRRYGLRVVQIPFAPDAFSMSWETAELLGSIWGRKK